MTEQGPGEQQAGPFRLHLVQADPQDDGHRKDKREGRPPEGQEDRMDVDRQLFGQNGIDCESDSREDHEHRAQGIARQARALRF